MRAARVQVSGRGLVEKNRVGIWFIHSRNFWFRTNVIRELCIQTRTRARTYWVILWSVVRSSEMSRAIFVSRYRDRLRQRNAICADIYLPNGRLSLSGNYNKKSILITVDRGAIDFFLARRVSGNTTRPLTKEAGYHQPPCKGRLHLLPIGSPNCPWYRIYYTFSD